MPIPELLSETLIEATTGLFSFPLVDLEDEGIDSSFLTTLTVTLYDVDSNQIINARQEQDILNANGGTVDTDPGPPVSTTVTLHLEPADTVLLNANRLREYRVLSFCWTWNGGQDVGRYVVQFGVENALHVP